MFSPISPYFVKKTVLSPIDFIEKVPLIYTSEATRPNVNKITQVIDWRKWLLPHTATIEKHTKYNSFKFTKSENGDVGMWCRRRNANKGEWLVDDMGDKKLGISMLKSITHTKYSLLQPKPLTDEVLSSLTSLLSKIEDKDTRTWFINLIESKGLNFATQEFVKGDLSVPPTIHNHRDNILQIREPEVPEAIQITNKPKPQSSIYDHTKRELVQGETKVVIRTEVAPFYAVARVVGAFEAPLTQIVVDVDDELLFIQREKIILFDVVTTKTGVLYKKTNDTVVEILRKEREEELKTKPKKRKPKN
ncbi:hypothetical protein AKO1_008170, partial [Acrasis kona]